MLPLSPFEVLLVILGAIVLMILLLELLWREVTSWVLRFLLGLSGAVCGMLLVMGLVWLGHNFNSFFVVAEAESPANEIVAPTPVVPNITVNVVMPTPANTVPQIAAPAPVENPVIEPTPETSNPETVVDNPVVVDNPAPAASTNIWWSSPDAVDSTAAEYALGDSTLWTYSQLWDGRSVETTIHVAVAPGVVLRITGYVGTRYQLSQRDDTRWNEMRLEVQKRDKLSFVPPLVVIESPSVKSPVAGWTVEAFPSPNP